MISKETADLEDTEKVFVTLRHTLSGFPLILLLLSAVTSLRPFAHKISGLIQPCPSTNECHRS